MVAARSSGAWGREDEEARVIASVHGTVQKVRLDAAVIEVNGVGMLVQATPATLAGLRSSASTCS